MPPRRHHVSACVLAGAAALASLGPTAVLHAANPPQIAYLLVLDGSGHTRTYFKTGQKVELQAVVYAPGHHKNSISVQWRVTIGHATLKPRSVHGFQGPHRGNLFNEISSVTVPAKGRKGTYTARATVRVAGGKRLSHAIHFYVR